MAISPISSLAGIEKSLGAANGSPVKKQGGDNVFAKLIKSANGQQVAADNAVKEMASGSGGSLQNVVLSAAKADLSFRLVLELRNKLMESYEEIMRMQV